MHTLGTSFNQQSLWRGADRHPSLGCSIDGQPTTVHPSMPLLYDMDISLMIMWSSSNSWTDIDAHSLKNLTDRADGEELIDTKDGGVHPTNSQLQPMPLLYDMGTSLVSMW